MVVLGIQLIIQVLLSAVLLLNLVMFMLRKPKAQLAVNILLFSSVLAASAYAYVLAASSSQGALSINPFSAIISLLVSSGMILLNVVASGDAGQYRDFAILGSFAAAGMYIVAFAGSLAFLLIGMELMVLPTIMAVLARKSSHIEAAVKLFVIAAIGAAVLSFAIVLAYGASGTISFTQAPVVPISAVSMVLFIASLGFEASIFPFNMWVPDTYQGSPTYMTAMLGGLNKPIGFVALIETMFLLFSRYSSAFSAAFYVLAVLTMFYGNLIALAQKNVKRMLAYSSISQAGYMAIALAVASQYSLSAIIFYMFAYMLMFIGSMAVVAFMETRNRREISDYTGLLYENRYAAVTLTIMMLSMAGVPLTAGFVGKYMLFSSAVYSGMMPLALIAILNSVISVYYYLKVMMAMFARKPNPRYMRMQRNLLAVSLICLALVLVLGLFPNLLATASASAASYVVGV